MRRTEKDNEKESLLFAHQDDYFHMSEPDDVSVSASVSTNATNSSASLRNRTNGNRNGSNKQQTTSLFSNFTSTSKKERQTVQSQSRGDRDSNADNKKEDSLRYLMNDVDQTNYQDLMFSTLDKIEDNFDEQAYEDLIPLNIRMALENKVFGWNHLYSTFLGHVIFPVVAYTLTFWIVSLIGLKYVAEQSDSTSKRCDFFCMVHKPYYKGQAEDDGTEAYVFVPILGFSATTFIFVRIFFSLNSALNAFRTVRRRRKVWLHSYGTAEYFKENGSRKDVLEHTDRNTVLGGIRKGIRSGVSRRKDIFLARRVEKKIRKATGRFERRQQRRRKKFITDGIASYENDHHERVQLLSGSFPVNKEKTSKKRGRKLASKRGGKSSDLKDTNFNSYEEFEDEIDYTENEREGNDQDNHFYGLTMPTFAMQSIAHDQIPFPSGPIQNMAYAHGGFFGAAPFMLANPYWIDILRRLMPDVYVEISRRVVNTPIPQLIHWAENNPVVAAYGTAHELEYCGKVPTLEWDVFLDPHLVQRVEVVLKARDDFLEKLSLNSRSVNSALKSDGEQRRYTDKMSGVASLLEPNERSILFFYNTEIQKRVEVLIENMLIAHGNLSQLALEQTGFLKRFNFSRIKHTRRTLGGGMFAKHWIPIFAEALKLSVEMDSASTSLSSTSSDSDVSCETSDSDDSSVYVSKGRGPLDKQPAGQKLKMSTSFQNLSLAAVSTSSIASSISVLKKLMKCDAPLGLILDFKSRYVPRRVWALVIDTLRNFGMRVEGIGSFITEEIRDISQYCSAPVKEIIFLHSAGDLQKACHDGKVKRGDCVFFNAGSLFWNYPIIDRKHVASVVSAACSIKFDSDVVKDAYKFQPYARVSRNFDSKTNSSTQESNRVPQVREDEDELYVEGNGSTVQQYKEYLNLSIGMYVQEFAIDDRSIDLIASYVNRYPHVYNLGLSWGGVNGVTVRGIQPGRLTNTDGFWNQRYGGERWDPALDIPETQ